MASDYLNAILTGQAQRRVTGGGTLTPGQVEGAAMGDIAAQYQAGTSRRQLDIAQQNANTAAAAEKSGEATSAANIEALKKEEAMAPYQTAISAAGAAGQLGIGGTLAYSAAKQAGLFGATAPVGVAAAGDYALAGSAAATGGTPLSSITGATVGGGIETGVPAAAGIAAYTGVGAAGLAGGYVGSELGQTVGEAIGVGGEKERGLVGGIAGGAAAGALAGTYAFPGVGTAVGAVVGGVIGGLENLLGIGGGGGGCIILGYLYGPESKQARTAYRYCARFMDTEALVGYYQVGKYLIPVCERHPLVKRWGEKYMARPFYRYMRWKLGKEKSISWWEKAVSRTFLGVCRLRYRMGNLTYFPQGSQACMAQAMSHKEVQNA